MARVGILAEGWRVFGDDLTQILPLPRARRRAQDA